MFSQALKINIFADFPKWWLLRLSVNQFTADEINKSMLLEGIKDGEEFVDTYMLIYPNKVYASKKQEKLSPPTQDFGHIVNQIRSLLKEKPDLQGRAQKLQIQILVGAKSVRNSSYPWTF